MTAPITRFALMLQHQNPGREWSLEFLTSPEFAVVLKGVEPTRDEMAEVLSSLCWAPVIMIDVCMAAAGSAKRQPN